MPVVIGVKHRQFPVVYLPVESSQFAYVLHQRVLSLGFCFFLLATVNIAECCDIERQRNDAYSLLVELHSLAIAMLSRSHLRHPAKRAIVCGINAER